MPKNQSLFLFWYDKDVERTETAPTGKVFHGHT